MDQKQKQRAMVTFRLHANKDTRLPLLSRWKFFLSKQYMLPDYRIVFPTSICIKEIKCKLECHDFPCYVSVYEDRLGGRDGKPQPTTTYRKASFLVMVRGFFRVV